MTKKNVDIWTCKIGYACDLPDGADAPLRQSVQNAYKQLTGEYPEFVFSGWRAKLTPVQEALVRK